MTATAHPLTVGGKPCELRLTRLAAFRLGGLPYAPPEYSPKWSGDTLFRWAVIQAWAMLTDPASFASPEDLAAALADDEVRPLLDAVNACFAPPTEQKKSSMKTPRSSSSKRA